MSSGSDIMELPFDLFTRNLLITKLIDAIRENGDQTLTILDVGGRAGNVDLFLSNDDLHILDIRRGEEGNYVVGDIAEAPYKNDCFDVVMSSDVYEHIIPGERLNVISEMLRIANNYVILGAPFDSKDVQDAEIKACDYYSRIVGEPHLWLKEHIDNGLPSKKEFETFLDENGFEFLSLRSNNISNWLLMQLFIFYSYKYSVPIENVNKVYRYYNENFPELGDMSSPTYRTIYLIGKKGTLPEVDLKFKLKLNLENKLNQSKYHTFEALIFEVLGQLTDAKDEHIHNIEAIENEKSNQIKILNTVVNIKDEYIEGLETTVKNKDEYIQGLETTVKNKDEYIQGLETTVKDHDEYIQNLNSLIAEKNRILNDIYNSTTWQLLAKYQRLVDIILPHTTKRRHAYDLTILGIRLIVNDGVGAFTHVLKERLRKNYINTSKIPMLETKLTAPYSPLSLEKCLCGRFTFLSDNLSEIRISTATNNRMNSDLTLYLTGNYDGKVLRKVTVKQHRILDNGYTSFRFKTIKNSKDISFSFRLVSKNELSAAVWYNEMKDLPDLQLYYDDKKISGSIGFQAFANMGLGLKNSYDLWILKNEPTATKLEQYRDEIKRFEYQPKISIVTPVYNPDVAWIESAIGSVRNQVYENWELCLADASTKNDVRECLKTYAKKDPRIKVDMLPENKGISGNSNAALALASGEYIGLLDHDDEITPDALYEVVKYLQENRDTDMIYTDEDKTDLKDNRRDPFFKPDWSRDTFLSCMYTCHFGVYRKSIIDEIGGFREKCDGSQDYDIVLRFIEKTDKIHHIPKILYHWRTVEGSVATNADAKSYAYVAAKRALTDYMERNSIAGDVSDGFWIGSYRMKRKLLMMPLVSIIIVSSESEITKKCIADIEQTTDYTNYEIIVAAAGGQKSVAIEKKNLKVVHCHDEDNVPAAKNFAASHASGEYLLFLDDNMKIINSGWIGAMLEQSQRLDVGAVGAKIISSKNKMQHCGIVLGLGNHHIAGYPLSEFPSNIPGYFGNITIVRNCSAVTDACMMIRKDVFEDAGGFANDLTVAFNDVDLCLNLRQKGLLVVYTPYAELCNHGSLTPNFNDAKVRNLFLKDVEYMRDKWGEVIDEGDPYYSPNLTLDREDCSIRV